VTVEPSILFTVPRPDETHTDLRGILSEGVVDEQHWRHIRIVHELHHEPNGGEVQTVEAQRVNATGAPNAAECRANAVGVPVLHREASGAELSETGRCHAARVAPSFGLSKEMVWPSNGSGNRAMAASRSAEEAKMTMSDP
jgi:hypothetical protein